MARTERSLEHRFTVACRKNKVRTVKGESRNNVGFPDRIVFNPKRGYIHYIEFKNDTYYKQTPTQQFWQNLIKMSGGEYFLLNGDKDLEDYLNTHIREHKTNEKELDEFYGIDEDEEVQEYYEQTMEKED